MSLLICSSSRHCSAAFNSVPSNVPKGLNNRLLYIFRNVAEWPIDRQIRFDPERIESRGRIRFEERISSSEMLLNGNAKSDPFSYLLLN